MIFFTSDQHYHHANVIKYCNRPFKDVYHMNEELIRLHNETVSPEDTVYHIGDFTLSKTAVSTILPRLNGIHHLVMGNHDVCHPAIAKSKEKQVNSKQKYLDAGFKTIELSGTMAIMDHEVLMSHFPYYNPNPEFDQRYPQYRPKDEGLVLLHGHVHEHWQAKYSNNGSLMINVGVDVWNFRPVPLEELIPIIRSSR